MNMNGERDEIVNGGLGRFLVRTTACHVVTYFIFGAIAFYAFDYATAFASANLSCYMLPTSSKWVALGPALQVFRGLIFALALYPFRRVFLESRRGWLSLWGLLLGLSILSSAGPSPGSVEGLIYTRIPWLDQLVGLREVVAQTLAFSYLLVAWYQRPRRAWGAVIGVLAVLAILLSIAGAVAPQPAAR
jgi:hypothetical protein